MKSFHQIPTLLLLAALTACGGGGTASSDVAPDATIRPAVFAQVAKPALPPEGSMPLSQSAASSCGLEHVWVTVQAIRMYGTDAAADADAGASELVLSPPRRIDLVGLTGGLLAGLGAAALPAGRYGALRLVLAENGRDGAPNSLANAVQVNGQSQSPLTTPGAARSGIKVPLDLDVAAGQTADVVLGFDPCTSVVQAGKSGRYNLKPVISAQPRLQGFVGGPARLIATTTAPDARSEPHVAALAGGGYVVVWTDLPGPMPSSLDGGVVHAQRYDAAGNGVGGELLIYQGGQAGAVTGLPGGGFAVAVAARPGGIASVLALRFDASGVPVGSAQTAFTAAGIAYAYATMAGAEDIDALPDGGYVVTAWVSIPAPPPGTQTHVLRRFDASGAPAGDPIWAGGGFGNPSLANSTSVLANGSWLSAYDELVGSVYSPYSNFQTFVKLFSASGAVIASTNINPNPAAEEELPATAALKNGNYVVAWSAVAGTSLARIQIELFDPTGSAASGVVDFNPPANAGGPLVAPRLTPLADGGFLLSVAQLPQDPSSVVTVVGQYFDSMGHASGPTFELGLARQVPYRRTLSYSVAPAADGGFVFVTALPSPGTGEAISLTRFKPAGAP